MRAGHHGCSAFQRPDILKESQNLCGHLEELPMSTATAHLTVDQFVKLWNRGHFGETSDRKVELLFGEVVEMLPPNPPHEDVVDLLTQWSFKKVSTKEIRVRIQNTIGIPELDSLPLPDVVWVKAKSYRRARPRISDVLLLIEVSDSSVSMDRNRKRKLYAQAGISDYWIVNIPARQIEVFRDPHVDDFATKLTIRGEDELSPLCRPKAKLTLPELSLR
jgi:Uma2 family endonuclease